MNILIAWVLIAGPVILDLIIIFLVIARALIMGKKMRNLSSILEKFLEENGK